MRLDKFLKNSTSLSRSEAVKALSSGRVSVGSTIEKRGDIKIDENLCDVYLDGKLVHYTKYIYIMLNKPLGVVSATTDKTQKTVLDLIPKEYLKYNLFPCGRLDKNTSGLVILTNNGAQAHRLLSPKNHVTKTYAFECAEPIGEEDVTSLEAGITLLDGYTTKPCKVNLKSPTSGIISITEGKYHEIRRMFGALHNKITSLCRLTFGEIVLDNALALGQYRFLNPSEIAYFENY